MKKLILLSLIVVALAACSMNKGPMATATLSPTANSTARGTVQLHEMADGAVAVEVSLTGVPAGVHGFHVHDKGDCGDNGNAAGGHFNPMGTPHAGPATPAHHAGDFGNVTAGENGQVRTRFTTRSITVSEGAASAVGRAVILHANPDDLMTQPTGNAGGRIACGVVTLQAVGGR